MVGVVRVGGRVFSAIHVKRDNRPTSFISARHKKRSLIIIELSTATGDEVFGSVLISPALLTPTKQTNKRTN
jgi:hypothetical protein